MFHWFFLGFISCFGACFGQDISYPTLNSNTSYCLEFTWFGPQYDNNTQYNGTCDDYREDSRAGENIPCASPLVISYDGTIPDINYLWDNYKASVLCRKANNQECVTYTFWDNGIMANQTHMCARIRADTKNTPMGCFKQKDNGYEIELCICRGGVGYQDMPCNSGANSLALMTISIITFFVFIIKLI